MKKITLTLIPLLALLCRADAITYICGQPSGPKELVWSTCEWTNNLHGDDPAVLPGKPGVRDNVIVRAAKTLRCDVDIAIFGMSTGTSGNLNAEGKKISIKKTLRLGVGVEDRTTMFDFKNCKVDFGNLVFEPITGDQVGMGQAVIVMTDSEVLSSGGLMSIISAAKPLNKRGGKSGFELLLEGKTKFIMQSECVLDGLYAKEPSYAARLAFKEKDGRLPYMQIKKLGAESFQVDVSVFGDIKKGRHVLLEILDEKDSVEKLRKITFKDKPYTLGEEFELGTRKAKIVADYGTMKGVKNDLVLLVD